MSERSREWQKILQGILGQSQGRASIRQSSDEKSSPPSAVNDLKSCQPRSPPVRTIRCQDGNPRVVTMLTEGMAVSTEASSSSRA